MPLCTFDTDTVLLLSSVILSHVHSSSALASFPGFLPLPSGKPGNGISLHGKEGSGHFATKPVKGVVQWNVIRINP